MAATTPTLTTILASDVKKHLVGLDPWLQAAAASPQKYDDRYIESQTQAFIRRFERESQFRINQTQFCSFPDGTYDQTTEIPVVIEPAYPYYSVDWAEYGNIVLYERPVIQVQRMRFLWNQTDEIYEVPQSWIHWNNRSGNFWIVPFTGAALVTGAIFGFAILQFVYGAKGHIPDICSFDYIAGLPLNWQQNPDWADLKRGLEEYCALGVLEDIGYMYDAGLTSKSINSYGAAQTLNYDRFMMRKEELRKRTQDLMLLFTQQDVPMQLWAV